MMNTIMWLVDDSKILSLNVTQKDLGPDPPIDLNTKALTILLPGLSKWGEKGNFLNNVEVILLIEPSSKFSHLYIRGGKIVAAVSLSIQFVVNVTGKAEDDAKNCLKSGDCVVACNLNATLPLSAALHINSGSVAHGLLHSITI